MVWLCLFSLSFPHLLCPDSPDEQRAVLSHWKVWGLTPLCPNSREWAAKPASSSAPLVQTLQDRGVTLRTQMLRLLSCSAQPWNLLVLSGPRERRRHSATEWGAFQDCDRHKISSTVKKFSNLIITFCSLLWREDTLFLPHDDHAFLYGTDVTCVHELSISSLFHCARSRLQTVMIKRWNPTGSPPGGSSWLLLEIQACHL